MVCGAVVLLFCGAAGMSDTKKETSLAPILIGAAALGVALVFLAVYFLSGFITRHMAHDVPHLGPQREDLPIHRVFAAGMYPTARPVGETDARIAVDVPASGSFQVVSEEFETHDELDEVVAYYRKLFANEVEESREAPDPSGKPGAIRWTFKEHTTRDRLRIISVKEVEGRPHIRLVWMGEEQP
jgi:hypothetical protein